MSLEEAHQILFRGQSNVAVMAARLSMTTDDLKESFRGYAALNPIDEGVWQGDIELSWPYL